MSEEVKQYPKIRELDGYYFRVQRDGKWLSICFTDLTQEEQENILNGRDNKFVSSLILGLAKIMRSIGDRLDISYVDPDKENE